MIGNDRYWLDVFKSIENLQLLLNFITDPLLTKPYTELWQVDFYFGETISRDSTAYKQVANKAIYSDDFVDDLVTLRSFKSLVFLTEVRNFRIIN